MMNTTVFTLDRRTEEEIGVFVTVVNEDSKMLRSNSVQCTGLEGMPGLARKAVLAKESRQDRAAASVLVTHRFS
jgi:hypothetical protein